MLNNISASVKWYEPLAHDPSHPDTISPCIMGLPSVMSLPAGKGWHEQSFANVDKARLFEHALRSKGFVLVEVRLHLVSDRLAC